jgi:phosphatidylserine decarboxylase
MLGQPDAAERYEGGEFLTIYLSPRHYHRIHAPIGGRIAVATHVPGALLPVNAAAVAKVPDLFARNERLICTIEGTAGRLPVVAVGAYNVGRIAASFERLRAGDGGTRQWRTNVRGAAGEMRRYDPPIEVRAGDEIMAFHLGSTVVLLFEPGRARLVPTLEAGREVRAGDPIARALQPQGR